MPLSFCPTKNLVAIFTRQQIYGLFQVIGKPVSILAKPNELQTLWYQAVRQVC